jgi:cysteine desulfurase family protein
LKSNELIYLNDAATAWPLAPGVTDAMLSSLSQPISSAGRGEEILNNSCELCRKTIARSINIQNTNQIILTQNATHSLNIAISGLDARFLKKVITTVFEHNSVLRPLRYRIKKEGGELVIIGLNEDGELDVEGFEKAIKNSTLVVITHASNVTGYILPINELFNFAKKNGVVTILDAAQTWGVIPVIPNELHADIIAFTGHKGMRGPTGTGALYIAEHVDIEPVFSGGTGIWSELGYQPVEMPIRLEVGTPNEHGFSGLNAAINWNIINFEKQAVNSNYLHNKLISELQLINDVKLFGMTPSTDKLPIVSFQINNWPVEEVGLILNNSFNIKCRTGLHCAPLIHKYWGISEGTIRFSLSGFNTEDDIDSVISAIRTIIRCR